MSFSRAFYFCFYGTIIFRSDFGVNRFTDEFNVSKCIKIIISSFSNCDLSEMSKKDVYIKHIKEKKRKTLKVKSKSPCTCPNNIHLTYNVPKRRV